MKTAKEILQDEKTWNKTFAKYPFGKYEEEIIISAMEEYSQEVAKNLHKPPVSGECEHPYHYVIGDGEMQPAKCLKCRKIL